MAVEVEDARLPAARPFGIDDRGNLAVGVDRAEGRKVLLTLAGIDRDRLIRKPGFLQEQRDLRRVGCGVKIEADHRGFLPRGQVNRGMEGVHPAAAGRRRG